jgi:hypothetical protein
MNLKAFYILIGFVNTLVFANHALALQHLETEKEVFANNVDAEKIYLQLSGTPLIPLKLFGSRPW